MDPELENASSGKTPEEAVPQSVDSALLALYVSLGLAYTWYALCFLSFGINQSFAIGSKGFLFYSSIICTFVGMLASYLLVPRLSIFLEYRKRKGVVITLFASVALGIFLASLNLYASTFATESIAAAGCLIMGAAIGAIALLCKEFACGLERGSFNMCICVAALAGIGIFCLSSTVDPLWQLIAFSIATLLAFSAVYAFTSNLHREDSPEKMSLPDAFKRLDLKPKTGWFLALYGNVLGLKSVEFLALRPIGDFPLLVLSSLGFSAGILIALVVLLKHPRKMMLGQAQRLSFPFLIIGLLPWNLIHEFPVSLGFVWIFAVCAALVFIDLDTHYFLSRKYDVPAIYTLTLAFRSFIKGLVVGALLGVLLFVFGRDQMLVSLFGLFFVIFLSFLISLIREEPDRSAPEPTPTLSNEDMEPAKRTGLWKECCLAMAKDYRLTSRETEILVLMLKAMTIERISAELFISAHTTKTHIYHIYQKIEVKNRGDLTAIFQKRLDEAKGEQRG